MLCLLSTSRSSSAPAARFSLLFLLLLLLYRLFLIRFTVGFPFSSTPLPFAFLFPSLPLSCFLSSGIPKRSYASVLYYSQAFSAFYNFVLKRCSTLPFSSVFRSVQHVLASPYPSELLNVLFPLLGFQIPCHFAATPQHSVHFLRYVCPCYHKHRKNIIHSVVFPFL